MTDPRHGRRKWPSDTVRRLHDQPRVRASVNRRSLVSAVLLAAALTGVRPAGAGAPPEPGVELGFVMATAVERSPDLERGRLAVDARAAARLAAASPFDLQIRARLASGRSHQLGGDRPIIPTDSLTTHASGAKRLRSGVVVATDVTVARLADGRLGIPVRQATSSVSVRIPIAAGRDGGAAAGAERSAREAYRAAVLDRGHAASQVVLGAVIAYWRYLAATERLAIHTESARRAASLVDEIEALIRADERPASDRHLMASNLAIKRTAQSAAEQARLDALYALGLAMGLDAEEIPVLGPPVTPFPAPTGEGARIALDEAIRVAAGARLDLAASRARRNGARLEWEGARRDYRSRWDIVASVGHTGVSIGRNPGGPPSLLDPSAAGLNAQLQMEYVPVAPNSNVRSLVLGTEAAYRATVVVADDLDRHVRAEVRVAVDALANSAREALLAADAVRLSMQSVSTEEERLRLGLSTLFDAILAADALMTAQLFRTDAQLRHAAAIARLRFETGTLLEIQEEAVRVDPQRVIRFAPREEMR